MSTTQGGSSTGGAMPAGRIDMKLEVVVIPVSDVNRSKEFFSGLGWRLDADIIVGDDFRIVQFTAPCSGCSISFGNGVTDAPPGSARHLELIASDIEAARQDLIGRGVKVSETFRGSPFNPAARISGPDTEHQSYKSYAEFEDPDGNGFLFQEVTHRLPGRIDPSETRYVSVSDLANAMRRASVAHGEHEQRTGTGDANWPDWSATDMVAEQSGEELPG